jgi:hypothetical protein|tara:strand:+ start:803 stop:1012 length:210 start_codon:yes stop_codon:yes gene_type:complete
MRLLSAYLGLDDTWQSFARDAHLPLVELDTVDLHFVGEHDHLTPDQVAILQMLCTAHDALRAIEEILND